MKQQNDILTQIDRHDGLSVPEGYFDHFTAKMIDTLPYRSEAENPSAVILPTPTLWTRIRPYTYLAAMFAGIWCMLKMFSIMVSPADTNSIIDNNPTLAEAIGNEVFINDYIMDNIDQWDVIDEMLDDGYDCSSFEVLPDSADEINFIDPASYTSDNE